MLPAEVYALMEKRRSVRRYTPRPVPGDVVERLLSAARWAPSAHNRQPLRLVVLSSSASRERLAEAMGAQLQADRLADGDPAEQVAADVARSRARITEAPLAVLACLTLADMDAYPDARRAAAERLMAVQSVALAVQNLLLAAEAEGLGACWLCAPLFCPGAVRATLDLPADWEAQALVTLGYPAGAPRTGQRRPLAELVLVR